MIILSQFICDKYWREKNSIYYTPIQCFYQVQVENDLGLNFFSKFDIIDWLFLNSYDIQEKLGIWAKQNWKLLPILAAFLV